MIGPGSDKKYFIVFGSNNKASLKLRLVKKSEMAVRWKPSVCLFINLSEVVEKRRGGVGHLDRHHTGHQLYIDVTPPFQMILLNKKRRIVYICIVQFNLCRSPWAKLCRNLAQERPSISCK